MSPLKANRPWWRPTARHHPSVGVAAAVCPAPAAGCRRGHAGTSL